MIVLHTFLNDFQALLSKKELFEISGEISKRFAPVKPVNNTELIDKSVLTQQELLEVSQNISRYYAPRISSISQKLVVLSIDPQHLYVYWNLDENQDYTLSRSILNKEMVLRVYSQLKGKQCLAPANPLVEIAINDFHSRQKIYLPAPENPTVYSASIGQSIAGDGFVSMIDSNTTHAVQGAGEHNSHIKKQDNAIDYKNAGFIDVGVLYDSPGSEKSHFAAKNNSGKGKR